MKNMVWINTIFFIVMVSVNAIANLLPLGGNTTGQVSAKYQNLFTPAPYTFAIWGVIYAFMLIFIITSFIPDKMAVDKYHVVSTVGIWFTISCILNIAWIFCWHFDYIVASVVVMAGLLISLIIICLKIKNGYFHSWRGLVPIGFQIYLGWICAATIANVSVMLKKIEWSGWGADEQFWTIIVLLVGTVIGVLLSLTMHQQFSTFAICWAYFGILVKHVGEKGYGLRYKPIVATIIICLLIMLLLVRTYTMICTKKRLE